MELRRPILAFAAVMALSSGGALTGCGDPVDSNTGTPQDTASNTGGSSSPESASSGTGSPEDAGDPAN